MKQLIERLRAGQSERLLAPRSDVPAIDAMPGQGEAELAGRRAVNFGTDDALGLATDSRVKEAATAAKPARPRNRGVGPHRALTHDARR